MTKYAVVKSGGKQYLLKENDEIIVDRVEAKPAIAKAKAGKEIEMIELNKLAEFDDEKLDLQLGNPTLKEKVQAQVISQLKGDKIRVAKFKAKVRYRKVKGFRARLTKLKITKI